MKKIIILCLFLQINIFAQSTWILQNDPGIGGLYGISFINSQTGWISGNSKVIKTTNGGNNWELTSSPLYSQLNVFFINENVGWAGSYYGPLLKTTNGGISWNSLNLITYGSKMNDIFFINENTGWTTLYSYYYGGYIFKTTDMGESWFEQLSLLNVNFSAVQFIDQNTGWICGLLGKIYKTTNAGTDWFLQYSNTTSVINDIFFINVNTGWAVGNAIRKTTDGGNSWLIQNSGITATYNRCRFKDSNNGWLVGYNGIILRTTNGGIDWQLENSGTTQILRDIIFTGNDTGFVIGGYSNGVLLKTTDDGYNPPAEPNSPTDLEAVADSSKRINLSWTDNSNNEEGFKIERSSDGGINWNLLYTGVQNTTSYPDTGLIPYSVYFYRLYAFNSSGNSGYSNISWDTAKSYKSCDNIFILITKTNELKNANIINQGQANALIVKLNAACEQSSRGQYNAAINQMGAFINQVNAFISAEVLTQVQGEPLINIANDIIYLLQGGTSPLKLQVNVSEIPSAFVLYNNYPNPFNPVTKIKFDIPKASFVKLIVYDITGKEISVLVDEELNAGRYNYDWSGINLPSGVYFYKLITESFSGTKKLILLK